MSMSMTLVNLMSNVRWGLSGWNTADWCSRKPLTCSRCSSYPCFKAAGFGFCFVVSIVVVFVLFGSAVEWCERRLCTWHAAGAIFPLPQSLCFCFFVSVLFFSVVTVVVAFVLFGSAEEWCDGSHWHAGGARGVTYRMLLESCICVWPKVDGSQPHPTLFLDADLLLTDASVRPAQLVLTIGSSQGGWGPCRGNIMIHECSEC